MKIIIVQEYIYVYIYIYIYIYINELIILIIFKIIKCIYVLKNNILILIN